MVDVIAKLCNISKAETEKFMNVVNVVITEELSKGGEVPLFGIGKLKVVETKAKEQKLPSGKVAQIPAKKVIKFVVGKATKQAINV